MGNDPEQQEPCADATARESDSQSNISWPSRVVLKIRNKFEAYKEKGKNPDYRKERRERVTIFAIFLTAAFALAQGFIFFCQLREMEKVYEPIRDQATAAIDAAKASRDNFRVDQRPYIWLTNDINPPILVPNTTQIAWSWKVTNYGKTPARRIRYFSYMKIDKGEFKPNFRRSNRGDPGVASPLPPNKTDFATVVSDPGITPEEFTRLMSIDESIAISVKIEYLGASDERYESAFCFARLASGAIMYMLPSDRCENDIK